MTSQPQKPQDTESSNSPRTPASQQPPTAKEAAVQPSGPRGDNPGTAGPGQTAVRSKTPENNLGHLNPSAPEDANITPGTAGKK
jgi:hypothetical protein